MGCDDARGVRGKLRYACSTVAVAVGLDKDFQSWCCELRDRLRLLAFVALAHFYPVLLRVSLGSFMCNKVESQRYWSVDMSMKCWKGPHLPWVIIMGAVGVLVLALFVPIVYNFTLIRTRAAGANTQQAGEKLQADGTVGLTGVGRLRQYLYGSYRERCKAWEGLLQMRLVLIVLISVASPSMGPYYTLLSYGGVWCCLHDLARHPEAVQRYVLAAAADTCLPGTADERGAWAGRPDSQHSARPTARSQPARASK